jgi:ABC-type branched-subunit amino acid transport system substrate-binding protein
MEVVQKFRKKYGENMDAFAMHGYACAYVLKEALERSGSTDSDKLLKALKETDLSPDKGNFLPTKGGRIQFDEIGENKNIIMMSGQILNQKREIIFPPQYKTNDPVFPIPKWNERG